VCVNACVCVYVLVYVCLCASAHVTLMEAHKFVIKKKTGERCEKLHSRESTHRIR
jgi:hypothetical protein